MSEEDLRRITHALLRPQSALAAVAALRGRSDRAAVEGLVELIYRTRTAAEAVAAIHALEASTDRIVFDALGAALDSPHASVRLAAVQDLQRRRATGISSRLGRVLCTDESWLVRRTALNLLTTEPGPQRWRVLDGANDPHWRVRHALIRVLLAWGESKVQQREIDQYLAPLRPEARIQGLRAYLSYRWTGCAPETAPVPNGPDASRFCSFWDWDAAVLLRNLERLGEKGRRQALGVMPFLLQHTDERIRSLAGKTLRDWGAIKDLVPVAGLLAEPRQEGFACAVKLLGELDEDRKEELARTLLHSEEATPAQLAWALDQVGHALPVEEEQDLLTQLVQNLAQKPPLVRGALARLLGRWPSPAANDSLLAMLADHDSAVQGKALRGLNQKPESRIDPGLLLSLLASTNPEVRVEAVTAAVRQGSTTDWLGPLAEDPEVRVRVRLAEVLAVREEAWALELVARLQADPHPHVRASTLTPHRSAELLQQPSRETSWHVLATAGRLARVPLWKLEPALPWRPAPSARPSLQLLQPRAGVPPQTRLLGPNRLEVAPLGISGHYGLPVQGFVRAYEAGVNLMFWEPNYRTMTEFFARLSPADRGSIHLVAGTFEADGEGVQRDAERLLQMLKVEQIAIFLLFWVQSWHRVTPDVREALEQLQAQGKIGTFGLSTHSRPLAVEAIDAGWDPVMVRHSAAHRGAEESVFPRAAQRETSLITFSNTCYGRLLEPHKGMMPPRAGDCYRYTLLQPGVRACLSAPATLPQLEETLAALRDPDLPEERRNYLRSFGDRLYEEETMFRKWVRFL